MAVFTLFNPRSAMLFVAMLQGLVIGVMLLYRNRRAHRPSDWLLAGLLWFLVCSLITHFIGFMGVYDIMRERGMDLTFFPFGNGFAYGPFILLYVRSLTDSHFRLTKRDMRYFIPAIVYYGYHLAFWGYGVVAGFEAKMAALGYRGSTPYWDILDSIGFYAFTAWCIWLSFARYAQYRKLIEEEFSNTADMTLIWLRGFLYLFTAYFIVDLGFAISSLWVSMGYVDWYWQELIRAVMLYYLSTAGYGHSQRTGVDFTKLARRAEQTAFSPREPVPQVPQQALEVAAPSRALLFSAEELALQTRRLLALMKTDAPWLDPELTLSQLSAKLRLSPTQLSYVVNAGMGQNFNDFVNTFRVEAVKARLLAPESQAFTLLGIALDCGFNSKATFNRAFKKATGSPPNEFGQAKG